MEEANSQGSESTPARPRTTGGWWTLPTLSCGLALIACALIVSQVEENRQLSWQRNKLQMDLAYLEQQEKTNEEFVTKLSSNANLVERLAQLQKNLVRKGSAVLDLKGPAGSDNTSPFRLVRLPPPPEVQPYQPAPGLFTRYFGTPRQQSIAYGLGAFMVALGLIGGGTDDRKSA